MAVSARNVSVSDLLGYVIFGSASKSVCCLWFSNLWFSRLFENFGSARNVAVSDLLGHKIFGSTRNVSLSDLLSHKNDKIFASASKSPSY